METWYQVTRNAHIFEAPEIREIEAVRHTKKMLFRKYGRGDERAEAIDTRWYRSFPSRLEAVRYVEHLISNSIYRARMGQESAIADEKRSVDLLAKWRADEAIEPAPGTCGGVL